MVLWGQNKDQRGCGRQSLVLGKWKEWSRTEQHKTEAMSCDPVLSTKYYIVLHELDWISRTTLPTGNLIGCSYYIVSLHCLSHTLDTLIVSEQVPLLEGLSTVGVSSGYHGFAMGQTLSLAVRSDPWSAEEECGVRAEVGTGWGPCTWTAPETDADLEEEYVNGCEAACAVRISLLGSLIWLGMGHGLWLFTKAGWTPSNGSRLRGASCRALAPLS